MKAYFALKVIGDDENAEHMQRARRAIHAMGGAEMSNVFTRIQLALYGAIPWRAVPMMPVEIMLLPQWFPFHLSKVSYWARTVIVPLLVLNAKRPLAKNPRGVRIDELFIDPPVNAGLLPRQGHQSPAGSRSSAWSIMRCARSTGCSRTTRANARSAIPCRSSTSA